VCAKPVVSPFTTRMPAPRSRPLSDLFDPAVVEADGRVDACPPRRSRRSRLRSAPLSSTRVTSAIDHPAIPSTRELARATPGWIGTSGADHGRSTVRRPARARTRPREFRPRMSVVSVVDGERGEVGLTGEATAGGRRMSTPLVALRLGHCRGARHPTPHRPVRGGDVCCRGAAGVPRGAHHGGDARADRPLCSRRAWASRWSPRRRSRRSRADGSCSPCRRPIPEGWWLQERSPASWWRSTDFTAKRTDRRHSPRSR
jgi:hypothetical protein